MKFKSPQKSYLLSVSSLDRYLRKKFEMRCANVSQNPTKDPLLIDSTRPSLMEFDEFHSSIFSYTSSLTVLLFMEILSLSYTSLFLLSLFFQKLTFKTLSKQQSII